MEITDKQLTLWRELGSGLSAPPALCEQAFSFYSTYKSTELFSLEKSDLVFKVAFFLAEKAQILYDREGNRLKSIAFSANSILRDHPKHQQFLYHLLQMVRAITIPPSAPHLEEEVSLFSRHFSSSLTFLNKLKGTLKKIKINRRTEEPSDYSSNLTRLLWLLFVDCREQNMDIVQNICLLGCIISYYLINKYQEDGIFSIYFQNDSEGCTLPNQMGELTAILMTYLHIKDVNTFNIVQHLMEKYFNALERKVSLQKFFHHHNIHKSVYIVQKQYERKLGDGRLDQSTFLRNNETTNQPMRVTPFARRAPLASKTANALSHRILNFQNWEQQQNKASVDNKKQQKTGLKFLSKVKMHPTPQGTLIKATPVTQAIQAYNWIYQKVGNYHFSKDELLMIQDIFDAILGQGNFEGKKEHYELAGSLWKDLLKNNNKNQPRSVMLIAVYLTCHVLNLFLRNISTILKELQFTFYNIWECLDQILNSCQQMPLSLKLVLHGLETSFVSKLLWNDDENIQMINLREKQMNRLTIRITHQTAYLISFLSKKLELNDQISDTSFMICQEALQQDSFLLANRQLEQIIVCSMYAAIKVKEISIKFGQILQTLKEVLGLAAAPFNELVEAIPLGDREGNIIEYYNKVFVPVIRPFLKQLRTQGPESSPSIQRVREIIGKENIGITTQQANYFAYCQSPLLKNKHLKQINYNLPPTSTIKRESTYGLADIEAKFSRFGGNALRQTRKILKY